MLGWDDAGEKRSRRISLRETRDATKKRSRHQPSRLDVGLSGARRINWKLSAGVAGVLVLAMTLAGFVSVFSVMQQERIVINTLLSEGMEDVTVAPEAEIEAPESHDTSSNIELASRRHAAEQERQGAGEEEGRASKERSEPKAEQTKPNVFFIMIDDMGWNDIGYQSNDLRGVTPHLDQLAAGGIKLTQYYSMSICTPARASFMTGRYAMRYGMQYNVIQPGAPWGLPLTEKIFPQYMKDAGYETHMIGKWHLGSHTQSDVPSQRGFDTFMGYLNDEEMYWTHQSWRAEFHGRKFVDFGFGNATGYYDIVDRPVANHPRHGSISSGNPNDKSAMLSPTSSYSSSVSPSESAVPVFKKNYSTRVFQDRAIEILEQKTPYDEEPLYMYLSHQAVHDPLGLPPDGSFNRKENAILDAIEAGSNEDGHLRKRFAKVLMYLDQTIGELVEYLETEGWMDNSIIVVASDNGGCPEVGGCNYPLRGIKHTSWDGGSKVPAFVYSKSHIPEERRGTEYKGLMHVTDWLPTLAAAAGIGLDLNGGAGPLDGVDHWDYLANAELAAENGSPRHEMMYNFDPYILWANSDDTIGEPDYNIAQGAYRSGKYKYIANEVCSGFYAYDKHTLANDPWTDTNRTCDGTACTDCGRKICASYNVSSYLFDLEADPNEQYDLIGVYPEIAESLRERWVEVAFSQYMNSSYVATDENAYYVWTKYNWWMTPWKELIGGVTEDPFGINSAESSSDASGSSLSSSISDSS